MITVLTPTFNREHTLKKAYNSLINQTNKNFEWFIVDDGSTDNTEKLIKDFIKEKKINIKYYKQENGGKHTALNYGIKKIKSDYTIILDSDDELTNNAIEEIYKYWEKYKDNKKICALSFLKVFPNNKIIGKKYEGNEIISNHINFRYNKDLLGDMCEVFKTNILKNYPFPVFEDEKFLSEAIVWNKIALEYDTVYINKPIYIANYYNDGLSKNFLKLVYNNPIGASENANMFLIKNFKFKIRIKNAILYDGYSLIAKKKNIIKNSNDKFLTTIMFPLGTIFYLYMKLKNK